MDFFSRCDQIRSFPRIWLHLLKKSLVENFIFCAVIEMEKNGPGQKFISAKFKLPTFQISWNFLLLLYLTLKIPVFIASFEFNGPWL